MMLKLHKRWYYCSVLLSKYSAEIPDILIDNVHLERYEINIWADRKCDIFEHMLTLACFSSLRYITVNVTLKQL